MIKRPALSFCEFISYKFFLIYPVNPVIMSNFKILVNFTRVCCHEEPGIVFKKTAKF